MRDRNEQYWEMVSCFAIMSGKAPAAAAAYADALIAEKIKRYTPEPARVDISDHRPEVKVQG